MYGEIYGFISEKNLHIKDFTSPALFFGIEFQL
jgi:hypothetical protein